MSDHHNH